MIKGPVSVVLCGIGGMGAVYLKAILDRWNDGSVRLAGTVDPVPDRSPYLEQLQDRGVAVYPDLESFFRCRKAELAVISSPIPFHAAQTRLALSQGSHVLCEKPAAATVQEVRDMIAARDRAGRTAAIGFQWSFSDAVQALKSDVRSGRFGAARSLKCLYGWPRDFAYYRRNDWAGKRRDPFGAWILDSPAHNAMAHDLHNILYILGRKVDGCALPVAAEAELYRAYDIENFDTAAVRLRLEDGATVLFLATHAGAGDEGPVLRYTFECGTVAARGRGADLRASFADGSEAVYGNPDAEPLKKLWDCVAGVRSGAAPVCGPDAALGQTLAVNAMQDAAPEIVPFPAGLVRFAPSPTGGRRWVEGLDEAFARCFEEEKLPSEIGVPWSRPAGRINLTDYRRFPSRPA